MGDEPRRTPFPRSIVLALVAFALACAPARGGWDPAALEASHREIQPWWRSRLADVVPHFTPQRGGLALFLCRWSTGAPIPVSLPVSASAQERDALLLALAAWQGAGLGVSFSLVQQHEAHIEIEFAGAEGWTPAGSGDTVTDCAIADDFDAPPGRAQVAADISFASIYLRRENVDMLGRASPMTRAERVGAALHELGHALGFAGHAAAGSSLMRASPEAVRRIGAKVVRGEPLHDAALSALYGLPSGVVVGQVELAEQQLAVLRRLAEQAREAKLDGPYVRAGERAARLFWRDAGGRVLVLSLSDWPAVIAAPSALAFEPNAPAFELMRDVAVEPRDPH